METKAKTKSIFSKMLVVLIIVATLIAGIFMAIPKTGEVHAAEPGSSATLGGYVSYGDGSTSADQLWTYKLKNPITVDNIYSLLITTNPNAIQGFIQGENIKINTSQNDLYYYYKSTCVQVDTDGDHVVDSDSYDIVIYADVETIYAPECSQNLFYGLGNCKSIIFDNFDTSLVTDMSKMFAACINLESIDFSENFITNQVTNMDSMFHMCTALSTLNLSNFNTSKVTDMSSMFSGIYNLAELDLSGFSFESITSSNGVNGMLGASPAELAMEYGIDVKKFANATYDEKISIMVEELGAQEGFAIIYLAECSEISNIIAPDNLNGLSIALPGIYNYVDSNNNKQMTSVMVTGKTHEFLISSGATLTSAWRYQLSDPITTSNIASILITTDSSAINGFTQGENIKDSTSQNDLYYYYKANAEDSTLYDIVIYINAEIIFAPKYSSSLFYGLGNCKSIVFESFDTSSVTNMFAMFRECSNLTTLDLRNFNTSKNNSTYAMFAYCSSLSNLYFDESFDTSSVTDMESMFLNCSSLTYVDTSNFNTSKVSNFFGMFAGCSGMEVLDLSSFSFDAVTANESTLGMIGINDTMVLATLQSKGATDYATMYQQAIDANNDSLKLQIVAGALEQLFGMTAENAAETAQGLFATYIHTIYTPQNVGSLAISLPYNNNGTFVYDDGTGEQTTQFLVGRGSLQEMAIYPQGETPNEIPEVELPQDPTLPESGVELIDLIILTMLTLTISGVSLMLLKRKKVR